MATKHRLGRGLGALIRDESVAETPPPPEPSGTGVRTVPLDQIRANSWQPRREFDASALAELTESVRERGILQPLLVRRAGDQFELIAGERRLRAARAADLEAVPVLIMEAADSDALELALVENLQREDLNVLEEADGYRVLAERFDLTQEQIAGRVGKARASVTNTMRLLRLPPEVKELIANGGISSGHAKLLTGLDVAEEQILFAQRVVRESLSVRNLEKLLAKARQAPRKPRASRADMPREHVRDLCDRLHRHFGTSVRISPSKTYANGRKARGTIEIEFYSNDDLDRILELLALQEDA